MYKYMTGLCRYADIFGKPQEGAHRHFGGVAMVDVLATLLAAYAIAYYYHFKTWKVFVILILLSIPIHVLFCVDTTLTKLIGKIL